jgi:hypothetical protein
MSQREGAMKLGLNPRWVRKLLVRWRQERDGGIVHRGGDAYRTGG